MSLRAIWDSVAFLREPLAGDGWARLRSIESVTSEGSIRTRLRLSLAGRLRVGDRDAVDALRAALSAIDNAEALPLSGGEGMSTSERLLAGSQAPGAGDVHRRALTEGEMRQIVVSEIDEKRAASAV